MPVARRDPARTHHAITVAGLGSLTQPGARDVACRACGSTAVTCLDMTLTDGTPVVFVSCHDCEHRTWSEQGQPLAFSTVLDKTRKSA